MKLGANTWIWVSPLTDERLTQLAPRVRDMGFDVVELPIEQLGDWSPSTPRRCWPSTGSVPRSRWRWLRGVSCVAPTPRPSRRPRHSCGNAWTSRRRSGRGAIAGPIYTSTGRTWRITPDERVALTRSCARTSTPVADHAGEVGVKIGDRAARPLRDEPDQHRRAGAGGHRPAARLGRAAAGHLPRERGGEGLRRRRSASADRGSRTSTPRPTTAAPPAPTTSTGPASATPSATRATTARSSSSPSPPRTRRSPRPPRSGARSPPPRTPSPSTAWPSCATLFA